MPKSDRRRKGGSKLEVERMRLVACGVIAMANTRGSAAEVRSNISDKYKSDSLNHVMRAVDAEMRLREECDSLRLKLTSSLVREQVLLLAMQKLAKLGNGDQPGNSDGNRIAQKALSDRHDAALTRKAGQFVVHGQEYIDGVLFVFAKHYGRDGRLEVAKYTRADLVKG